MHTQIHIEFNGGKINSGHGKLIAKFRIFVISCQGFYMTQRLTSSDCLYTLQSTANTHNLTEVKQNKRKLF